MTTAPIGSLIISLAVPAVISMMATAIYNTADTYFVSRLGTSASAAVGVVFSLMAIFQAIGFTLGMGAGCNISRLLGANDLRNASCFSSTSFFGAMLLGALLSLSGLCFIDRLVYILGATETIHPYAKNYAHWILLGAPIMCASFTMNNFLRAEGHAAFGTCGLVVGGFVNIILDPLFIFVLDLGISGAAMATLVSQIISFSILLSFFIRNKSIVKIHPKYLTNIPSTLLRIIFNGSPSLSRQGLASISTAMLNAAAARYGDAAVAAMAIVNRIFMLILSIQIGIGHGFVPVVGFNYGARQNKRVRASFFFAVRAASYIIYSCAALCFIFAPELIACFRNDPEVVAIGRNAMRWQCIALLFQPIFMMTNMLQQSMGYAGRSTFLACSRQGYYFIPLVIILPRVFGLSGVEAVQAISDIASSLTALPFLYAIMKILKD